MEEQFPKVFKLKLNPEEYLYSTFTEGDFYKFNMFEENVKMSPLLNGKEFDEEEIFKIDFVEEIQPLSKRKTLPKNLKNIKTINSVDYFIACKMYNGKVLKCTLDELLDTETMNPGKSKLAKDVITKLWQKNMKLKREVRRISSKLNNF